jgi:hypothetical protein
MFVISKLVNTEIIKENLNSFIASSLSPQSKFVLPLSHTGNHPTDLPSLFKLLSYKSHQLKHKNKLWFIQKRIVKCLKRSEKIILHKLSKFSNYRWINKSSMTKYEFEVKFSDLRKNSPHFVLLSYSSYHKLVTTLHIIHP